jgi:hypothetical protein
MTEPGLWRGLQADEPEAQERAALAIYDSGRSLADLGGDAASAALRSSVNRGNHSAAAILLLGRDSSSEAKTILTSLRNQPDDDRTKLRAWSPVVGVTLAAAVALSRLGDTDARSWLIAHIEQAPLGDLEFLLDVAKEIDDPAILHALATGLDDERPVRAGVPSGAEPQRRLADLTVDALTDRLGLSVSFPLRPSGQYSAEERQEVRRLLRGAVPQ